MPLPFFDQKRRNTTLIASKTVDSPITSEVKNEISTGETSPDLRAAAEDLLNAIDSRSILDIIKALDANFTLRASQEEETQNDPFEDIEA